MVQKNEDFAKEAEIVLDGYKKFITYLNGLSESKQPD